MKKNVVIIILIILIVSLVSVISYKYIVPTYTEQYTLKGDYIPSIKTVLHQTKWVSSYKANSKNSVYLKTYEYKNQDTVLEDLKTYTNYLIQMEQFEVLQPYDLQDINNSSIYLGKKSHINDQYILLVDIEYTADSYKIVVSKKKGTLLQ